MPSGDTGWMPTTLLVVSAAPDCRASTKRLKQLVDRWSGRHDMSVRTWFLRSGPLRFQWPDALVVDDLRTWAPVHLSGSIGLRALSHVLSGRRLRWWLAAEAPDVVLLDDGLGSRVLCGMDVEVAVRFNEVSPVDVGREVEWHGATSARLVSVGSAVSRSSDGVPTILESTSSPAVLGDPVPYRRVLMLDPGAVLVSVDGWLDAAAARAAAVFATRLAELMRRRVDLVWFRDAVGHEDLAARLPPVGSGVRFLQRPAGQRPWHLLAEVALVLDCTMHDEDVVERVRSGQVVVGPRPARVLDPGVIRGSVEDAEVSAAVAGLLVRGRDELCTEATDRWSIHAVADRFADSISAQAR